MYLSSELTKKSFPEIGRRFGGKDHTTVMHACRKIRRQMTEQPDLADEIVKLSKLIMGETQ